MSSRGQLFVPAGDGETSFVDARDVAVVGVEALADSGHGNRSCDATGPEALTYAEAAAVVSDVLDRDFEYAKPGLVEFIVTRAIRRGEPVPFALVKAVVYTTARLGIASRANDDGERVLGRSTRSLADFVRDHTEAFERSATPHSMWT